MNGHKLIQPSWHFVGDPLLPLDSGSLPVPPSPPRPPRPESGPGGEDLRENLRNLDPPTQGTSVLVVPVTSKLRL